MNGGAEVGFPLSGTGETDSRKLATLRLSLDRKRDELDRKVAKMFDPEQIQTDMFVGLLQGKGFVDEDGPVQQTPKRITKNAETAINALNTEKHIQAILNRFMSSRPATPLIEEKELPLFYRVENKLDVMVAIENRTGRTLRDCVVITEAKVDVAKINQAKLRKDKGDEFAYVFMKLLEVDKSVRNSTKLLEEARNGNTSVSIRAR